MITNSQQQSFLRIKPTVRPEQSLGWCRRFYCCKQVMIQQFTHYFNCHLRVWAAQKSVWQAKIRSVPRKDHISVSGATVQSKPQCFSKITFNEKFIFFPCSHIYLQTGRIRWSPEASDPSDFSFCYISLPLLRLRTHVNKWIQMISNLQWFSSKMF